ncbi:ribonuclease catalytic domain-containing protein [Desulfovibrio sp. OttesenSCG-928-C14]|nr:ribonuclease catalytic domain-containing protein [Desulfovibrio sp. OttesenSCG-928-C14]
MTKLVRYAAEGCVVELMQGNKPLLAWVLEESAGQLRLLTLNKREMKLQSSRLLPWIGPLYGPGANRAEIAERLERHRIRREELAASLDAEQLWDLAQGEIAQAPAQWFAELVWPEPGADEVAAMGQALLGLKTHFKFTPPFFEIYSREQVETKARRLAEEEARSELAAVGTEFLRKLYEAYNQRRRIESKEEPAPEVAERLREILLARVADPDLHDPDGFWKLLLKGLPPKSQADEPWLPVMLAQAWSLLPEHYNFWLDRAGYERAPDWHAPYQADLDKISRCVQEKHAEFQAKVITLTDKPTGKDEAGAADGLVSIDPSSTVDWDDALAVRRTGAGYLVRVALACPALCWPFGSELDKAVLRRGTSLYLPEGDLYMMPEGLALEHFSLRAGQDRPCLLLEMELDSAGEPLSFKAEQSWVRVAANLSQAECETVLAGEGGAEGAAPHREMLLTALELAGKLKEGRLARGAVITDRPEVQVCLREENGETKVDLLSGPGYPLCSTLVGELMILSTASLAAFGRDNGVPLLYRSQDVALPREFSGIWTREEDIAKVLKALPPSLLSLEPKAHAGLGLKLYSSFTAPMRRYPDLLNQAQVLYFMLYGRPRLDQEELSALLPVVNMHGDASSLSQRYRPRYWKLLWFQQQEHKAKGRLVYHEAVITEENSYFINLTIPKAQLMLRAPRQLFHDRTVPGTQVRVRVGKIHPLRNEIQIMEVLEG